MIVGVNQSLKSGNHVFKVFCVISIKCGTKAKTKVAIKLLINNKIGLVQHSNLMALMEIFLKKSIFS
jgi:hypothetical protein